MMRNAKLLRRALRGRALVIAVVFLFVVSGVAATMLAMTLVQRRAVTDRLQMESLCGVTDGAIATAMGRIMGTGVTPHTISGTIAAGGDGVVGGMTWSAKISQHATNTRLYKVTVAAGRRAVLPGGREDTVYRAEQALIEEPLPPVPGGIGGAITSYAGLQVQSSSVVIDGNNVKFNGTPAGAGAVPAITTAASSGNITLRGTVVGNGETTSTNNNAQAIATGVLEVGQPDIPNTPGRVLGVPDADLRDPAKNPAFFTSLAQWTAFKTNPANFVGGYLKNTAPIYFAFTDAPVREANDLMDPGKSYILINHVPAGGAEPPAGAPPNGTSTLANINLNLKGIVILDDWLHINAGTTILGSMVSLYDQPVQLKFAQGGADFYYSAETIGLALRDTGTGVVIDPPKVLSYVENPAVEKDLVEAMKDVGILPGTTTVPPAPAGWRDPQ